MRAERGSGVSATFGRAHRELGDLVWVERRAFGVGLIGLLGVAAAQALQPWPIKLIIDHVLLQVSPTGMWQGPATWMQQHPLWGLGVGCVIVLVIAVLRSGAHYLHRLSLAGAAQRFVAATRSRVFARLLALGHGNSTHSGDLVARVTEDIVLVRDFVSTALIGLVSETLTLAVMCAVMLWLDPILAGVVLLTLPMIAVNMALVARRARRAALAERSHEGHIARVVVDTLSGIDAVQAFTRESEEERRFTRHGELGLRETLRLRRLELALGNGNRISVAVGVAIVLFLGAGRVVAGQLTPGELLVFVAYATTAHESLARLTRFVARSIRAMAAVDRVLEVFDWELGSADAQGAHDVEQAEGHIEFRHVTAGYTPGTPVLEDVDFVIEPGTLVAIVGPPGGGKSTLLRLLMRQLEPQSGCVCVDRVDVREWRLDALYRSMSVALQESSLFSASVHDNIAFGRPNASAEQVERAARRARAHGFIEDLPEGYASRLGARGVTLSTGQRRRVAMARAVLKRSSILLLDEPSSGLDAETEARIARSIRKLADGRTTLAVTHRPALVAQADCVLRVEHGRVSLERRAVASSAGTPLISGGPAVAHPGGERNGTRAAAGEASA